MNKRIIFLNKYIEGCYDYVNPYASTDLYEKSIDTFREDKQFREYIMDDASRTGILVFHHYPDNRFDNIKRMLTNPFVISVAENYIGHMVLKMIKNSIKE